MPGPARHHPDIIFLRRANNTGYGFFYSSDADFKHAADSFTLPVLRTFRGPPLPNQPDPQDHLRAAIATFLVQAFDRKVAPEIGAEGISRAAAAFARQAFRGAVPPVAMIERGGGRLNLRPAPEFLRHPGHPLAVVVEGDTHGGDARFFANEEEFRRTGESQANARCWLPQIIYRLYARTPSVMVGKPITDDAGRTAVECRALFLGVPAPLFERGEEPPPQPLPPPTAAPLLPEPEPPTVEAVAEANPPAVAAEEEAAQQPEETPAALEPPAAEESLDSFFKSSSEF